LAILKGSLISGKDSTNSSARLSAGFTDIEGIDVEVDKKCILDHLPRLLLLF
jgi:hypothetical protein